MKRNRRRSKEHRLLSIWTVELPRVRRMKRAGRGGGVNQIPFGDAPILERISPRPIAFYGDAARSARYASG